MLEIYSAVSPGARPAAHPQEGEGDIGACNPAVFLPYHLLSQWGCGMTKNSRELPSFPTLQAALL